MAAHRHPFRGEPVSVVTSSGNIMRARARGLSVGYDPEREAQEGARYMRVTPTKAKHQHGNVRTVVALAQEGITWCRGWNGPAASALKTVVALREGPKLELTGTISGRWSSKTVTP